MNAVPFVTLKLARDLEAAGLAAPVAAGPASEVALLESRFMAAPRLMPHP